MDMNGHVLTMLASSFSHPCSFNRGELTGLHEVVELLSLHGLCEAVCDHCLGRNPADLRRGFGGQAVCVGGVSNRLTAPSPDFLTKTGEIDGQTFVADFATCGVREVVAQAAAIR